jgi:hypothetical protein
MMAPTKQLDWGERISLSLTIFVTSNNRISTSDEYEPLVNEDETPPSTV